ncbi:MAG: hypothetical protein WCG60_00735, partial [bacterium]
MIVSKLAFDVKLLIEKDLSGNFACPLLEGRSFPVLISMDSSRSDLKSQERSDLEESIINFFSH